MPFLWQYKNKKKIRNGQNAPLNNKNLHLVRDQLEGN